MTFVWSFDLVSMLNYVSRAIANVPFDIASGAIVSVIIAVLIVIIGESFQEKSVSNH